MTAQAGSRRALVVALVRSCHPVPTMAVTALTALLAASARADLPAGVGSEPEVGVAPPLLVGLLVVAVLTGQLSIGWSNDLIDAGRDRAASRADKPLARDEVSTTAVRFAAAVALAATVVLSATLGWRAAVVHLVLVVGSGWTYNLRLKATAWSWLPYAVAFGSLPAVVRLAGAGSWADLPPVWMMSVGALLGVGAHLLNALPDLVDDERTGIRGLPHRLGQGPTRVLGPLLLLCGSVVLTLAPARPVPAWAWVVLGVCVLLAVVAWTCRGRTPFVAAIGIALVDVTGLALR